MGEWSDYFEDFPGENQANYVGGRFDPAGANAQREAQQKASLKLRKEQQRLDAEIAAIFRSISQRSEHGNARVRVSANDQERSFDKVHKAPQAEAEASMPTFWPPRSDPHVKLSEIVQY